MPPPARHRGPRVRVVGTASPRSRHGESAFSTRIARTARAAAVLLALAALPAVAACAATPPGPPGPAVLRPEVLAEQPHDTAAFTQGFEIAGDTLYEGTGIAGASELRELDPATGALRRAVPLPGALFGEGITVVDDRIWQLTWRDGIALEWDRATLAVRREVRIDGEGWGLCRDGGRLVRSDGTGVLRFHDPVTFAESGSVVVSPDPGPLNELECVDGQVWANVWPTDRIVRIDPRTGQVTAVVDAAGLLPPGRPGAERAQVLNGIAAVAPGEFLLTGKYWPTTYRVRFVP
ncbi:MAG: glutaminyl-peptide cyclotransferase [Pseudonocardia sp.]